MGQIAEIETLPEFADLDLTKCRRDVFVFVAHCTIAEAMFKSLTLGESRKAKFEDCYAYLRDPANPEVFMCQGNRVLYTTSHYVDFQTTCIENQETLVEHRSRVRLIRQHGNLIEKH